ncbi:MAG: hypothetical protein Q4D54_08635 [Eubacteriales bacterium]|nr:hypothetical protein [Eubacteriales bacterium]
MLEKLVIRKELPEEIAAEKLDILGLCMIAYIKLFALHINLQYKLSRP